MCLKAQQPIFETVVAEASFIALAADRVYRLFWFHASVYEHKSRD